MCCSSDHILRLLIAHGSPLSANVIADYCREKRLNDWLQLFKQFKQPPAERSVDLKTVKRLNGHDVSLDSADCAFLRRLAVALDLDYEQSWHFANLYFENNQDLMNSNGRILDSNDHVAGKSQDFKIHHMYTQEHMNGIMKLYFRERVASIDCLSQIFKCSITPQSWFQVKASDLIAEIVKARPQFISEIISALMNSIKKCMSFYAMSNAECEVIFMNQRRIEQQFLSELLFWSTFQLDLTLTDRLKALKDIAEFINLAKGSEAPIRNEYLISSLVNIMDIPHSGRIIDSSTWAGIIESNPIVAIEIDKFLRQITNSEFQGFILFIWAGVLSQFMDQMSGSMLRSEYEDLSSYFEHAPAASNQPPLFGQYAMSAFGSDNLQKVTLKLQKPEFLVDRPESKTAISASVMAACLSFLRGFEIAKLPFDNVVVQLLTAVMTEELMDLIDASQISDTIQSLLEYYLGMFPAYFDTFFSVLNIFTNFPEFPASICGRLNDLPYFPQNAKHVDINLVCRDTETEYRTTRPITVLNEIFKSFDFLVIEPNTHGEYHVIEGASKAVMRWQVSWSFWELLANVFIDFVSRPEDILFVSNGNEKSPSFLFLEKMLPFLQSVVRKYHIIGSQLDNELGRGIFVSVLPSIMENTAKLIDGLSNVQVNSSHSMDLIASLIDLMEAFAELYREKVFSYVRSCNLISSQTCHLASLFHQQERPSGRYPVTIAFLRLTDRLLLETRRSVYAELFRADSDASFDGLETLTIFMQYVVNTVFAGLQSWKFRYSFQKLLISKQCISLLSLVLSDPVPINAYNSKILRRMHRSKVVSYGEICSKVLDTLLHDENLITAAIAPVITASETNNYHALCYEFGSRATDIVENGLDLIHTLLIYRLAEPENSQGFESHLLALHSNGLSSNFIDSAIHLSNSNISVRIAVKSIKCLLQITTLVSGWTPRPPSFSSYTNPSFIQMALVRLLKFSDSKEVHSLVLRWITLSLTAQPSLAFEVLLSSNSGDSELVIWLCGKLKCFSRLLDEDVYLAYSISEFLQQLWNMGSSFEKVVDSIRKDGNLWTELSASLFSEKGLFFSTSSDDTAGHVRNAVMGNLIAVLSSELCAKSKVSNGHFESIVKNMCSRIHVVILMSKSVHVRMEVMQDLNILAGSQHIDADVFRKNSWCGQFSGRLEFGKSFVYTLQGLKSSESELAAILEQVNVEFSLRDSQLAFTSSCFALLSVMIAKGAVTHGIKSIEDLLSLVFEPPRDMIREQVQTSAARFLLHVLKKVSSRDDILNMIGLAVSLISTTDMSGFEDKLQKELERFDGNYIYIELLAQVLLLLFSSLNESSGSSHNLDARKYAVIIKFVADTIVVILSKKRCLSQNVLNAARWWLVALSSIFKSHTCRQSKLIADWMRESTILEQLLSLVSELTTSDLDNAASTSIVIFDIFGQLSESAASSLIVELNAVENLQKLKVLSSPFLTDRPYTSERLLTSILSFLSNLIRAEGALEKISFSVILYLDQIVPHTKLVFAKLENNTTQISAMHLNLIEQFSKLLSNMCKYDVVWQHRYFAFSDYYTMEFLKIARHLTDLLVHPNRFAELLNSLSSPSNVKSASLKINDVVDDGKEKTHNSQHREVQLQLFKILRNIYMVVYKLTGSGQVFLLSPSEWSQNAIVFVPVLEVTASSNGTTFGTLNIMLAFARDRIESALSKSAAQTNDRQIQLRVLSDLVQIIFLLFSSQTFYALESPTFDQRQKEQVKMEVVGEIVAAIDAYNERLETAAHVSDVCQLLAKLRSFIETQIR